MRLSNWTELPHMPYMSLHRVRAVVQLAIQTGMHARQVVSLKIVIDIGFPVAVHLINTSLEQAQRLGSSEARFLRQRAQIPGQGCCVGVEVDEDKSKPLLHLDGRKRKGCWIKILHLIKLWRADQSAIQPIGPTVVSAAEHFA